MKKGKESMIKTYQTKPVKIQAVQYNGHNIEEVKEFAEYSFVERVFTHNIPTPYHVSDNRDINYSIYYIHTLEGDMQIFKGDYIIKGIEGEFYPCNPDIFEQKYELIKER